MKKITTLITFILCLATLGCGVLPIKAEIKENHFRFENFLKEDTSTLEYVHLLCHRKKPTGFSVAKQYLSGEHNLWVKASTSNPNYSDIEKIAYVNFKVSLEANKSYMFNRKIVDNNISLWIQDATSGDRVSEIIQAELKAQHLSDYIQRKRQCKSSTI